MRQILIIEDDPILLKCEVETLEDAGFKAVYTDKLEESIGLLNQEQFDCILLDNQLKDGQSKNMMRTILNSKMNEYTPMILISGTPLQEFSTDFKSLFFDVLQKPVSELTLLKSIKLAVYGP